MGTDADIDKIIKKVAENLSDADDIEAVGGQFGFDYTTIQKYIKSNYKEHIITSVGTTKMIHDGLEEKTGDRISILRKVLIDAKLVRTAEKYCIAMDSAPEARSFSADDPTTQGSPMVDLQDILEDLATSIGPGNLRRVGLKLRFKAGKLRDYKAANYAGGTVSSEGTRAMLSDYLDSIPEDQRIQKLKAALEQCNLAGIADQYFGPDALIMQSSRNRRGKPQRTGETSGGTSQQSDSTSEDTTTNTGQQAFESGGTGRAGKKRQQAGGDAANKTMAEPRMTVFKNLVKIATTMISVPILAILTKILSWMFNLPQLSEKHWIFIVIGIAMMFALYWLYRRK